MKKIAVFCGSNSGFSVSYKEEAKKLGLYFAQNNIALVYGGAKVGLMGILADTIIQHKGKVFGFIPDSLRHSEIMHANTTEMIITNTMSERKIAMSKMADGYIALAGGFGTLDELFEVLTLAQVQIECKPIGLLNTNGFYNAIIDQLDFMVKEGFLKQQNKNMLIASNTIEELLNKMYAYKIPKNTAVVSKIINP